MLAIYTDPVVTKLTFEEAAKIMRDALRAEMLGKAVPNGMLALALGKSALETARFTKMFNSNFGNVKCPAGVQGQYTCIPLNEVLRRDGKDQTVWFSPEGELDKKGGVVVKDRTAVPPGHLQTRMRAWANPFDGSYDYVGFVRRNYPEAWEGLLASSPEAYVTGLKKRGYFTAPLEAYLDTTVKLYHEFGKKLSGLPAEEVPVDDRWDWQDAAVRAFAVQFDDIGIIRKEALRELSQDSGEEETKP